MAKTVTVNTTPLLGKYHSSQLFEDDMAVGVVQPRRCTGKGLIKFGIFNSCGDSLARFLAGKTQRSNKFYFEN